MREILFRGKRYDNGEWVYGYLGEKYTRAGDEWELLGFAIQPPQSQNTAYLVDPNTIGQFTELYDKNGKKIFEGDRVEMHYFFENHDPITLGFFEDEDYIKGFLRYDELGLVLIDENFNKHRVAEYVQEPCEELEVIGNIFDEV